MPTVYNVERIEREIAEDREEQARARQGLEDQREHEYRLAKLKYSTAGRMRLWQKVLIAFAKAPVWLVLAFRTKSDLPTYWQKFLDV